MKHCYCIFVFIFTIFIFSNAYADNQKISTYNYYKPELWPIVPEGKFNKNKIFEDKDTEKTLNKFIIGLSYIPNDKELAFEWLIDAAKNGSCDAKFMLGKMLYAPYVFFSAELNRYLHLSEDIEKTHRIKETQKNKFKADYKNALKLFDAATNEGCRYSAFYLADMYYFGCGVKKDYKKAFELYKKAYLDSNDTGAEFMMGIMAFNGEGTRVDKELALHYMKDALDDADYLLKQNKNIIRRPVHEKYEKVDCDLYYQIYTIEQNMVSFENIIDRLEIFNISNLYFMVGELYFDNKSIENNYKIAFNIFKKVYEDKGASKYSALHKIGYMYLNGLGVRQDTEKAIKFLDESEEEDAYFLIGEIYEKGKYVEKNMDKAREFYGKACDNGKQEGCNKYKELKFSEK